MEKNNTYCCILQFMRINYRAANIFFKYRNPIIILLQTDYLVCNNHNDY